MDLKETMGEETPKTDEEETDEENDETEESQEDKKTAETKSGTEQKSDPDVDKAIAKLKGEIAENADNTQLVIIGSELLNEFKFDKELAKAYLANKQTVKSVWDALYEDVQKHYRRGNLAVLPDEQVYAMARELCHLPPKKSKETKEISAPIPYSKKEKKKDTPTEEATKLMSKAVVKAKEEKKKDDKQMDLFDFLGGNDDGKNNA